MSKGKITYHKVPLVADDIIESVDGIKIEETKNEETEKWIWVTGYKGMDKDMKCKNDFQYEVGKRYDMPAGEEITACHSGFHMCLDLFDVFRFFYIGSNNRFFEVRALVRESDVKNYNNSAGSYYGHFTSMFPKLAAKSIEIIRELTVDEILAPYSETSEWTDDIKKMAIEKTYKVAEDYYHVEALTRIGYARPLAEYICNHCDGSGYTLAKALDSQPGLSMDTKINAIFSHI